MFYSFPNTGLLPPWFIKFIERLISISILGLCNLDSAHNIFLFGYLHEGFKQSLIIKVKSNSFLHSSLNHDLVSFRRTRAPVYGDPMAGTQSQGQNFA